MRNQETHDDAMMMRDSTTDILQVVRERCSFEEQSSDNKTNAVGAGGSTSNNSNTTNSPKKNSTCPTMKRDAVDHRLMILESLVIVDDDDDPSCKVERKLAAAAAATTSTATATTSCGGRRGRREQGGTSGSDGGSVLLVGLNHLKRVASHHRGSGVVCKEEVLEDISAAEEHACTRMAQQHQCQSKQVVRSSTTQRPPCPIIPGAHRVKGLNSSLSGEDSFRCSIGSSCSYDSDHRSSITPTKPTTKEFESFRTAVTANEEEEPSDGMFKLAVANPVDDDHDVELPHAQRMNDEEDTRRRNLHYRALVIAVPFGLLLIGLVLIVNLLLVKSKDDHHDVPQEEDIGWNNAPHLSPEAHVLSLLPDETLYLVEEEGSPQARAFDWLLEDLHQNSNSNFLQESPQRIVQRFSLATLFFSTRGERWLANDNWLSHTHHECDWYNQQNFKMKCTLWNFYHGENLGHFFPQFAPDAQARRCNDDGLYKNLWLDANNLVGEIPDELYLLTSLKTLSLVNNKLVGPLSSHIGQLTNLEGFFSFGMKQGGSIPTQIGLMTNLRGLGLLANEHTGTIPTELWSLTKLETLALGGNTDLYGTLPTDIGSLSNLRWFCVFRGRLTGTIPTEVGVLSNLEMFDLEGNALNGPIPSEVGSLKKMAMMSLHDSSVTGTIPTELGAMGTSTATLLNLGGNSLTGTIPSELGSLMNLEFLDISQNQNLVPSVPSQIELLPNLESLNV